MTVHVQIAQGGEVAISEEQDIVYRSGTGPLPSVSPRPVGQACEDADNDRLCLEFDVDEVVLFRFSALTYNAHRIHYDQTYAAEEGYPDLVVHGPLQALLMGEAMRRCGFLTPGREFAYRLVTPMYGRQRLSVDVWQGPNGVASQLRDQAGTVTARSALTQVHHIPQNSTQMVGGMR